jgi:hypothetical protein
MNVGRKGADGPTESNNPRGDNAGFRGLWRKLKKQDQPDEVCYPVFDMIGTQSHVSLGHAIRYHR